LEFTPLSIRELARRLDVSIGTVSRALNGKSDVNPLTRERVLAAAEALGYVANQSGRSLRQGVTNTIGFMIDINSETSAHGDTFFMPVFEGVQSILASHQLDLAVLLRSERDDAADYTRRIVARGAVDGLIISATRRVDPRIDHLIERGLPFVALGRSSSGGGHSWIDLDFEGVAGQSVARLVARGHRRIAAATSQSDANLGFVFVEGYRLALLAHGIVPDPDLVLRTRTGEAGGYHIGELLLAMPDPPTAILLVNEAMAIGLYRKLYEAGLSPGRDLAIIGFRHSPQARFLAPALTCFKIALQDVGVRLAEALLAAMPAYAALYPHGVVQEIWPMQLVEGESDDFAPPG
jgi:DNA-binding LacI/PurR family transcriptional regulator